MKYIKIYEDMRPINKVEDAAFEKLFTAFEELIFSELGYSSIYYDESRLKEFYKEGNYIFCLKASTSMAAYLIFDVSNANQDIIQNFIPEYLRTIKGLREEKPVYAKRRERNNRYFEIASYMYNSPDLVYNIDKIISQISLEDFQLKLSAFKYNI